MSEKQSAIKEVLTKIIRDTVQESVERPIRTMIKSIQMIRDRLNELETSVETAIAEQGLKIDKLEKEVNNISETLRNFEEKLQELPNSTKVAAPAADKPVIELKPVGTPTVPETVDSGSPSAETTSSAESEETISRRKITEEKIRALFNKLEQVLPSEEESEGESATEGESETVNLEISPPPTERVEEDASQATVEADSLLASEAEEEETGTGPEHHEPLFGFEGEESEAPLTLSEETESGETLDSESNTALDELTAELSELEIKRSDLERKLGDLAFDRMRGLITEEEYREKTQELRKNLENISKRIDEIMDRMRY
ncbi:MAG: hypothetical protein Q6352_010850 [Candidatus Freyrarchaeum guaymaensis]